MNPCAGVFYGQRTYGRHIMAGSNAQVRYLIVGGGLTAANAAQSIRELDKDGSVMIVVMEKHPPYDRPPLSKNFQIDQELSVEDILSKHENFYGDNRIQLHVGVRAV